MLAYSKSDLIYSIVYSFNNETISYIILFLSNPILFQSKYAKIRNRYNQVPHLTQDTSGKVTNSQLDTTNESQEVSPFPAGDRKAHRVWSPTHGRAIKEESKVANRDWSDHQASFTIYAICSVHVTSLLNARPKDLCLTTSFIWALHMYKWGWKGLKRFLDWIKDSVFFGMKVD